MQGAQGHKQQRGVVHGRGRARAPWGDCPMGAGRCARAAGLGARLQANARRPCGGGAATPRMPCGIPDRRQPQGAAQLLATCTPWRVLPAGPRQPEGGASRRGAGAAARHPPTACRPTSCGRGKAAHAAPAAARGASSGGGGPAEEHSGQRAGSLTVEGKAHSGGAGLKLVHIVHLFGKEGRACYCSARLSPV